VGPLKLDETADDELWVCGGCGLIILMFIIYLLVEKFFGFEIAFFLGFVLIFAFWVIMIMLFGNG